MRSTNLGTRTGLIILGIFALMLVSASTVRANGGSSTARVDGGGSTGGGISVLINGQVQLLDLVEAKPFKVNELPEFASLKQTLDQMRPYNQTLADSILRAIKKQEIYFYFTPFEILPTQDSRSLIQIDDIQVAAQRGKVVVINEKYWKNADSNHRIGLLLHEIILNRNPDEDRMMLRRVVDRIVTRDFIEEETFTDFLYAMGLRYPAGNTPRCKKSFDFVEFRTKKYVDTLTNWAHSSKFDSETCVKTVADFKRKLSIELYRFLPPSYCSFDSILMYHDTLLSTANLQMTTECLTMSLNK